MIRHDYGTVLFRKIWNFLTDESQGIYPGSKLKRSGAHPGKAAYLKGGATVFKSRLLAVCAASLCLLVLAACRTDFRDPTPTPLPLSGLKKVEYDLPSYRIAGLSDERFVSIGPDGEVYLVDLESGEKQQLTDEGFRKWEAVISGEHIAWIDQRRQIEIYDSARRPPEGVADDIFLYNLTTRELSASLRYLPGGTA